MTASAIGYLLVLLLLALLGMRLDRRVARHTVVEVDTSLDRRMDVFESIAPALEAKPMLRPPGGGPLRDALRAVPGDPGKKDAGGDLRSLAGAGEGARAGSVLAPGGTGSGSGLGIADGLGGGGGKGVGVADFFGVAAEGRKFVYVIDRSYSMADKRAFESAKRELLASLDRLTPGKEFQVIFYNDDPEPLRLAGKGLAPVSGRLMELAKERIAGTTSFGGTNHEKALRMAIEYRPDVIFYLTDADDMDKKTINMLTQLNQRGKGRRSASTIHVIQFYNSELPEPPKKTARQLAEKNHGTFRLVDVNALEGS